MQITDALYPGLNIDGRNGKKYFAGIFSNPITASSLYVLALLRQDDVDSWTQIATISADSDINSDESAAVFLQAALPALNDTLAAEYANVPAPVEPTVPEVPVEPTPVDPVPVTPVDPAPVVPVESWIERVARFLVSNTTVVDGFLVFATAGTSAPAPIGTDGAGTGSDAPVAPTAPVTESTVATTPVAIEQAPETQAPETPVVETPAVDAPVESVAVADPVVDAPVAVETPVVQEPGIVAEVPAAIDPIVADTTVEAAVEPAVVASSDTNATDTDIVTSIDAPVVSGDVPVVEAVVDAPAVVEVVEDNSPIVADANVGSAIVFNPNDL